MQLKTLALPLMLIAAIGALCQQQSTNRTSKLDKQMENKELATFGAEHLNVTDLERSVSFWKENIGMKVRNTTAEFTEMGTEKKTLVVLYPTAKTRFKEGYSGLYHLAIHPSSEGEFARILARLITKKYSISPTDHTMSKAIYLEDPDGITVEITFETPQRLARWDMSSGTLKAIDTDGTVRDPSDALDIKAVLKTLPDNDLTKGLPEDTKIGHVHLYVSNLDAANQFYKNLGFQQYNYF